MGALVCPWPYLYPDLLRHEPTDIMRMPRLRLALLLCAALALLSACGKDKDQQQAAASATPAAAVENSAHLLKTGDFDGLWQHVLTPADYKTMRADWGKDHDPSQATAEDRRKFAETMAELTAPDAEQTLFAKLQPQLAQYDKQYKDQLPVMIGIGQGVISTQIDNSKELTLAQRQQAKELVAALAQWAQQTPWGDTDKARQAIAAIVDSARKLDLKTLDQAYALDYPAAMQRYATAWDGFKQVLAVYGLALDDSLDSVKAETLETKGDTARVKVSYTVLDKPMSTEIAMIREDGRWYDADLLKNWRKHHAEEMARYAPPAAAGTVPAPAKSAGGR